MKVEQQYFKMPIHIFFEFGRPPLMQFKRIFIDEDKQIFVLKYVLSQHFVMIVEVANTTKLKSSRCKARESP